MKRMNLLVAASFLAIVAASPLAAAGPAGGGMGGGGMTKDHLGMMIYCDSNLSTPAGQSCQTCHHPAAGYTDPNHTLPVSAGVIAGRFGNRSSPTAAYQATAPDFRYDTKLRDYVGGQFWDGRAKNLVEQAKGPFLNPLEMNNSSKAVVVSKVASAMYASHFKQIYGQSVFQNVDTAYNCIADALAAYEKSSRLNTYNSKYDQYKAGTATLTRQERRGLDLFQGRAKCASCHTAPVFTNFRYHNVGTPRNPENPFYFLPPEFNPQGEDWLDNGLAATTGRQVDLGRFKTPTLRNIVYTAPYMHNGSFATLYDVADFMNTRNIAPWPAPETSVNITPIVGNLGLSVQDVDDIVAFLHTLSDAGCGGGGCGGGCGGGGGMMGG